jgi:hypothetical protein
VTSSTVRPGPSATGARSRMVPVPPRALRQSGWVRHCDRSGTGHWPRRGKAARSGRRLAGWRPPREFPGPRTQPEPTHITCNGIIQPKNIPMIDGFHSFAAPPGVNPGSNKHNLSLCCGHVYYLIGGSPPVRHDYDNIALPCDLTKHMVRLSTV